jgi:hypothetical protein
MKTIASLCAAAAALWLADLKFNDGRYGDATGRTIVGFVER